MNSAPPPTSPTNPYVVLATVLPAVFMQPVDITIVNVAIPSIQRDLGASYAAIELVVAGYQLAFACVLITAARLGDIYGRRRLFQLGMVGFTAASAACGAAGTPGVLVGARVVQGLASGLMYPQVLSVIQVTFAPSERGRAFAFFGTTVGLATITGPLLGGALIAADPLGLDWRSIFYVNVPIGVAAALAAARLLPESRAPDARALDLPGAALVTAGLFLLIYPLTEGRERGWPAWVFAMLVGSAALLTIFAVLQVCKTRRDLSPLVYITLFRDRAFRRGIAVAILLSSGLVSFFFVLTLYLQVGLGFSALHAGMTTLPFSVGSAGTSLASDRLVRRFGLAWLQAGCLLLTGSMAALAVAVDSLGARMTSWHLFGILLVGGVGVGAVLPPMTNVILASIQRREVGSASGVLSTGQQVGSALGVALAGIVFFAALPGLSAGGKLPPGARELAFAAALRDTLFYPIAMFAACFLLFFAVRRAHAMRPTA